MFYVAIQFLVVPSLVVDQKRPLNGLSNSCRNIFGAKGCKSCHFLCCFCVLFRALSFLPLLTVSSMFFFLFLPRLSTGEWAVTAILARTVRRRWNGKIASEGHTRPRKDQKRLIKEQKRLIKDHQKPEKTRNLDSHRTTNRPQTSNVLSVVPYCGSNL